uniref:HAMP domain-containing protein n=1 Tax=Magnetococcus massalia (strain MO-1) TaxID=451514 RepID=A0A1S7LJG9_MAGMO|nr:membrane protein of unknown function[Include 3 copies of Extracellular solute-binding protein domain, HAMP linker domain and Sporulation stage II, protein E C-terminal] [Candidatus Magnetococcus massalia]
MVDSGTVDAHAGLFYNKQRDTYLDYGVALRKTDTHIFFHRSIPSTARYQELSAYRIGVMAGDAVENYLKERIPDGHVVGYPDYETIMQSLRSGSLRVFAADTPTGLYHLKKAGLLGSFTHIQDGPLYRSDWFVASKEGNQAVLDQINAGMAQISEQERTAIGRRWAGDDKATIKDDTLIIGMDRSYAPFTFINAQGRPSGLLVDMWRAWSKQVGRPIRFYPTSWQESLDALKSGEIDIHSGLSHSTERSQWIDFSKQIYKTSARLFSRAGETLPDGIHALGDKTLGVMQGTFHEEQIRHLYPETNLQLFRNNREMLDALISNRIDVLLQEDQVLGSLLEEMGLQSEVISRPERLFVSTVHAGVLKGEAGKKQLASIDGGWQELDVNALKAIEVRWINEEKARFYGQGLLDADIGLTASERQWLNAHPHIRLGVDPNWQPYEFLDDQENHKGLSALMVERLSEILGIDFQAPQKLPWKKTMEGVKQGKIDLLAGVAPTPERQSSMVFTPPYMNWPNVIAIRDDNAEIQGMEDLEDKRIGVVDGYGIHQVLARKHPKWILVPQPSIEAGLQALSNRRIDAFVDAPATIIHEAKQLGLKQIILVAPTPYELQITLGVRKDWPQLATILSKALRAIPVSEREQMMAQSDISPKVHYQKPIENDSFVSTGEAILLITLLGGAIIALLALAWMIRTQRRPFLKSLRGKTVLFIAVVFLFIGGATMWVLSFVGEKISTQLGMFYAERHVLWHKEKVIGAVQRELALARGMAESELLMRWAKDEQNPEVAKDARRELQKYHDSFAARSYFIGLAPSRHFFYADKSEDKVNLNIVDTLSPDDEDDLWFFKSIKDPAAYNLNVDHNIQLGATNLWVNYAMRRDGETLGIAGTGIPLTDFINAFVAGDTEGVTTMMIDTGGAIQAHVDQDKIERNVLGQTSQENSGIWKLLSTERDRAALKRIMEELKRDESMDVDSLFLDLGGKRTLVALTYLAPLGWYSLATIEPGGMVGVQELGALAVVLGVSLVITLILVMGGQNLLILRPLNQLAQGVQRMSGGHYDVQLKIGQKDEIGDLTKTFNGMASTIDDYTNNLENKVKARTQELSEAYDVISSSIQYASRIQRALLPRKGMMEAFFDDHFVVWEPRDVVGGDLYWFESWGEGRLLILGDCTGHGVPGAFMTMIANGALEQALKELEPGCISELVAQMHRSVQISLGQHTEEGDSDDGLELGACYIPSDKEQLLFTGARFSLFYKDPDGEIVELKGDKKGIGYRGISLETEFTTHTLEVLSGRCFYMTSDGLIDQVGGEKRRGFGKKRFLRLVQALASQPLVEQGPAIKQALVEYQGAESRRDDLSLVGFVPRL